MVVAVVLAAQALERRVAALELAASYTAAFAALTVFVPPSAGVGFIAGASAAVSLIWPGSGRRDRVLAGVCAGAAAALYATCGLNRWVALLLGAGVLMTGALLVPKRNAGARDTILYLAGLAAVAVGLAPDVASGWRSARLLNHTLVPTHTAVPMWAGALLCIALLVGLWIGMRSGR